MIAGRKAAEKREERMFKVLEATLWIVNGGEEGASVARDILEGASEGTGDEHRSTADALEDAGFEIDASSALGAKLLDDRERVDAAAYYEAHPLEDRTTRDGDDDNEDGDS